MARLVTVRGLPKNFEFVSTGDWHVGSRAFHEGALDELLGWVLEKRHRYLGFNGDSIEGKRIDSRPFAGNLEDVAVHEPSGSLVLLMEQESALVVYDAAARREKKRLRLDGAAILGETPGDANQGFEGLAFRPQRGRPGGGIFYLAHQRAPAMVVALSFDPATAAGSLGAASVVARWPLDFEDLTAVAYAASIDRVLVLTDMLGATPSNIACTSSGRLSRLARVMASSRSLRSRPSL